MRPSSHPATRLFLQLSDRVRDWPRRVTTALLRVAGPCFLPPALRLPGAANQGAGGQYFHGCDGRSDSR